MKKRMEMRHPTQHSQVKDPKPGESLWIAEATDKPKVKTMVVR
jgi:hypothetical protein